MAGFACRQICLNKHLLRCFLFESKALSSVCPAVDNKPSRCRTLENDPTRHASNQLAKYYIIPEDVKQQLFIAGGFTNRFRTLTDLLQETGIMVRQPALETISYLQQMNYECPALRIILYGATGAGKSVTMMHLVHYAFMSKYLILHLPWVSGWTRQVKELAESQSRPGRFDIPVAATLWLQHFKAHNYELLKQLDLKTSKTYTWSIREATEEGRPLLDVVEHGLNRGRHASDCMAVILKEIKQNSSTGRFKTLVLIDGVNAFYCDTRLLRPDKTMIKANELTMVRAFQKLLRNDWNNAAIVATVDTIPQNYKEAHLIACTPRALLGKEGFEVLDPFIPVKVDIYNDKEIESVLDYLTETKWLQLEDAHTERGRAELKFLSGNNPYSLMDIADPI